jgi:Pectate lyase superfamily protein
MIVVGAACGGGGDSAEAAPPAGVMEPIAETAPVVPQTEPPGSFPTATAPQTEPTSPAPGTPSTAKAQATWQNCMRVPAGAKLASGDARRDVRSFGAKPNDNVDDTDEIQKALDTLKAGETLFFPSGRYITSRSLKVRRPGITITGEGATLHGTNPDDLALLIQADDTTVSSLTFTAITDGRRNAPRHARIAVTGAHPNGWHRIRNTVIRDNRIVNGDGPGTPQANSASTVGIFVQHAERFLITGNTVVRSLADGIHITGGSRDGRVLNNVVRETGDDLIGVVSYANTGSLTKMNEADLAEAWAANADRNLNRRILISGNRVSGQYAGRGISVVGGQSIAIVRNTIENIPVAAAILLHRETSFQTFGIDNVLVEGNILRDVQNISPPYNVANKFSPSKRTGHGAIDVYAALSDDEAAHPLLRSQLSVRNIVLRGNTVERAAVSGLRAGRQTGSGVIENLSVQSNRFEDVKGEAINTQDKRLTEDGLHCAANQRDGKDYRAPSCKADQPRLTPLPMSCSTDGRML